MPDESRVERLLRKAEAAIDSGDLEQGWNYAQIADRALEMRRQELEVLEKAVNADV